MKRRGRAGFAALLSVGLLLALPAARAPAAPAVPAAPDKMTLWTGGTQLRGASVYQRTVYPGTWDDPEAWGTGPLGPAFTQADFDALAAAGANLVVLSHAGLYGDRPPFAPDLDAEGNLDRLIGMAERADLFVVIALRTGPGRSEFSFFGADPGDEFAMSHRNDTVWKDRAAQDAWVRMWKRAAERYRGRRAVVGYELMVEPNSNDLWLDTWEPADFYPAYKGTTYDWNQLYPRISRAIREVDRDTPILVGAMSWSHVRWLPWLEPTGDPRTVYAFHQYAPQEQYTHQAAGPSGAFANRYPGRFDTDGDGVAESFDAAWIDRLLQVADEFKRKTGSAVAVTEYGAVRWEPGLERFFDDQMARFEKIGLNYSVWSWQPATPAYNAVQNEFNFRLGPDPADLREGRSKVYDVLKKFWSRNRLRPSNFR